MIKYILYYISCDKGELVTLESFFLPIITGILFLVFDTIFYSPEKFYVHTTETTYK